MATKIRLDWTGWTGVGGISVELTEAAPGDYMLAEGGQALGGGRADRRELWAIGDDETHAAARARVESKLAMLGYAVTSATPVRVQTTGAVDVIREESGKGDDGFYFYRVVVDR